MQEVPMAEVNGSIPVLTTSQELDQAVEQYRASNGWSLEGFYQWLAICNASIALSESTSDPVPGTDSY
ncbi:MAG: hypothetical protein ACKO24_12105 [Leptolyngbyaceae cyanobacterium]